MAGKSFRGVGNDKAPSRRTEPDGAPRYEDEDDSRGVHSGPTVVDDAKVAEVLKKLRSLDKPPGPLTGITEAVVDGNSTERTQVDSGGIGVDSGPAMLSDSGPARLEDIMYPLKRATSIGRSLSPTTTEAPVTIPADAGRGTMFGHSIHLPDVNAPDEAVVELSSGSVQYADGSPPPSQPFPLADRLAGVAAQAEPFRAYAPRPREEPSYGTDPNTDVISARRWQTIARAVALLGGVAVAGAVFVAVKQLRPKPAASTTQAAAAQPAAPPSAPSIVPLPSPAPTTTPAGAVPPAPAAEPVVAPANAAAADEPAPGVVADSPPSVRRAQPAPERRPARLSAPLDDPTPPPSKPSRSRRRATIPEDPDATLPPSM